MAVSGAALHYLDFNDHAYDEKNELPPNTTDYVDVAGKKKRGPNIARTEIAKFKDSLEWQGLRSIGRCQETTQCRFAQKANYKKCERLINVEHLNTSQEAVVLDNQEEHKDEINSDYTVVSY